MDGMMQTVLVELGRFWPLVGLGVVVVVLLWMRADERRLAELKDQARHAHDRALEGYQRNMDEMAQINARAVRIASAEYASATLSPAEIRQTANLSAAQPPAPPASSPVTCTYCGTSGQRGSNCSKCGGPLPEANTPESKRMTYTADDQPLDELRARAMTEPNPTLRNYYLEKFRDRGPLSFTPPYLNPSVTTSEDTLAPGQVAAWGGAETGLWFQAGNLVYHLSREQLAGSHPRDIADDICQELNISRSVVRFHLLKVARTMDQSRLEVYLDLWKKR